VIQQLGPFIAIVLSLAFAGVNAGLPPSPPTSRAQIESLTTDATKVLVAGDVITVTLRGSAKGTATFHIFGVMVDGTMQEASPEPSQAQPSIYTGKYTVRKGDAIRNGAVFATLRVGEQEVVAVSKQPVTIGTLPPVITSLHPASQAHLTNIRPNVVVRFFDPISGVNPAAVRMLVNGRDVSARAIVTETSASYSPEAPLEPGPVRVQVAIANQVKIVQQADWTFTIDPSTDLIKSVTITPTTVLKTRDVLTVVMTGVPGGQATFAIGGREGSIGMRESQPGLYLGTYTVQPQERIVDAPVVITLSNAGRSASIPASVGVTMLSESPPAPTIRPAETEVVAGKQYLSRIMFTGRALPGVRIQGEIALVPTEKSLQADERTTLGQFSTMAAADGTWRNVIGPVRPIRGTKLIVSVVAADLAGDRSPLATAEITLP